MFLRAAYNRRRDRICTFTPFSRAFPAVFCYEVEQDLPDGRRHHKTREGPMEIVPKIPSDGDKQHPWSQLRNSEVSGIEHSPIRFVSEPLKLLLNMIAIVVEDRIQYSTNVFNHHRTRLTLFDYADRFWKEIPLIIFPELLASDRERRTGKATSHKIDPAIGSTIERSQVLLDHIPMRTVLAERGTAMPVNLDQGCVSKACQFQTESLASRSRTKL
jgi:hypothetical protein